jgi:hypothetical protein
VSEGIQSICPLYDKLEIKRILVQLLNICSDGSYDIKLWFEPKFYKKYTSAKSMYWIIPSQKYLITIVLLQNNFLNYDLSKKIFHYF